MALPELKQIKASLVDENNSCCYQITTTGHPNHGWNTHPEAPHDYLSGTILVLHISDPGTVNPGTEIQHNYGSLDFSLLRPLRMDDPVQQVIRVFYSETDWANESSQKDEKGLIKIQDTKFPPPSGSASLYVKKLAEAYPEKSFSQLLNISDSRLVHENQKSTSRYLDTQLMKRIKEEFLDFENPFGVFIKELTVTRNDTAELSYCLCLKIENKSGDFGIKRIQCPFRSTGAQQEFIYVELGQGYPKEICYNDVKFDKFDITKSSPQGAINSGVAILMLDPTAPDPANPGQNYDPATFGVASAFIYFEEP